MNEIADAPAPLARPVNWRLILLGALALLGTGVMIALVAIQVHVDRERDRALGLQAHTYEAIIRATALSGMMAHAEAALGRYVVSGDKQIGQMFSDQWNRASDQLNRLAEAVDHSPTQRKQVTELRAAFDERGKELSRTALYTVHKRNRDALGTYYAISESDALRRVENRLTRVIDRERSLLAERKQAAQALVDNSRTMTRVLTVFGVLIVLGAVLLGWLTIEAQGERAAADREVAEERQRSGELARAVEEATEKLRAEAREREIAEAQLRQVQKMEAVGQLTGGIAHDFNNMLAVVLGGLELAKRHIATGGASADRHIEHAMEGANRAAALTRRLLAFARSEPLLPESVEAGQLIAGMADLLDRTLGDGIEVTTGDAGLGWHIWVDRHQLENALLNLAVNARDAMDGRGKLHLQTGGETLAERALGENPAGEYVTIAVRDTGAGMTPEVLERVFEPFFTTKPVGKGTGLGLSQIFGFVRQSGGEIAIDTAPGTGTTVRLYLPRHEGAHGAATQRPAPTEPVESRGLDILVVEDDPRVLNATVNALVELGHRPVACDDPLRAPEVLAALDHVDLLLSDVVMPGRSGPEMVAALPPRDPPLPVLFVTGFAGEADANAFGGHPVLRKPYTLAALARAVVDAAGAD